jgi:thiol-disulfide isomerase/thioredoxin
MKNKWAIAGALFLGVVISGAVVYATNGAPVVAAVSAAEAGRPTKPYVVKVHAKWCPVCMTTRGVWSQVQKSYADRVNLVVFDITNETTTAASRAEAKRLGLEAFFDEYAGGSGVVYVIDGPTKAVKGELAGDRDLAHYRTAIDAVLRSAEN